MHLMQDHPANPHLHSITSTCLARPVSTLIKPRQKAQWAAQYCKICCVRLAWSILLIAFCVCGSVGFWQTVFELFLIQFLVFVNILVITVNLSNVL